MKIQRIRDDKLPTAEWARGVGETASNSDGGSISREVGCQLYGVSGQFYQLSGTRNGITFVNTSATPIFAGYCWPQLPRFQFQYEVRRISGSSAFEVSVILRALGGGNHSIYTQYHPSTSGATMVDVDLTGTRWVDISGLQCKVEIVAHVSKDRGALWIARHPVFIEV